MRRWLIAVLLLLPAVTHAQVLINSAGGGGSTLTPGTSTFTDCTANAIWYADGSKVLQCNGPTYDSSGSGNGVFTFTKSPVNSSTTSNFWNVTGTFPVSPAAILTGGLRTYQSNANSTQTLHAEQVVFNGVSGTYSVGTTASSVTNAVVNTLLTADPVTANSVVAAGNVAVAGNATAATSTVQVGVRGYVSTSGGTNKGYAVVGVNSQATGTLNIGVLGASRGAATTNVGGAFIFGIASPTWTSAALLADNGTIASPVLVARDNGTTVFSVPDGGGMQLANGTKPTCDATARGTFFYTAGGAGVADLIEFCSKAAADTYAWRTLNTAIP